MVSKGRRNWSHTHTDFLRLIVDVFIGFLISAAWVASSDVVKKVKTEESGTKQKTGGGGLSVITLIDDARDRETLVRNFLMDRFLSLPS